MCSSDLEPEVLEDLHRGLGGQHVDVEHARVLDELVRVVRLVHRHGNLQRIAGDLDHRVHDAAVVDVVVVGGQDVKPVTDVEQGLGIHYSITEKLSLPMPQSGQLQLSGMASNGVPGAMPLSGSPFSGS